MHSCPECQQACYCDMEDHESELLDGEECEHECEDEDLDDLEEDDCACDEDDCICENEVELDSTKPPPTAIELEKLGQMRLVERTWVVSHI